MYSTEHILTSQSLTIHKQSTENITKIKQTNENQLNCEKLRFSHFREKKHILALELIFISSSWRVYMRIKLNTSSESLEWHKKRSLFAKWAIQNNSDALATAHIKWENKNNSTWVNFNSFTLIKYSLSSWVIFNLLF